jgi:hypothetical protein
MKNPTRQELRRNFRRNPIARCGICGKRSTRHNLAVHARATKATG